MWSRDYTDGALSNLDSARYFDYRAIDVRRLVRGEEGIHSGDFVGLAQAPERHLLDHLGHHRRRDSGEDRRGDEAGTHRRGANSLGTEFTRPGLGEGDHAGLGRGIVGLAEIAVETDYRRGIDDD